MKKNIKLFCATIIPLLFTAISYVSNAKEININTLTNSNTLVVFAHQDDDLLWMQPFWKNSNKLILAAAPTSTGFAQLIDDHQTVIDELGLAINYKDAWQPLWGNVNDDKVFAEYYWRRNRSVQFFVPHKDRLKAFWRLENVLDLQELEKLKRKLEPAINSAKISRIVTHNPWGEYGHQHHRLVNQAVTDLAVRYGKDVWVLGSKVIKSVYNDLAPANDMDYTFGVFDGDLFTQLRSKYQQTFVAGQTSWTGGSFNPTGRHLFLKTVDKGNDVGSRSAIMRNAYTEVLDSYNPALQGAQINPIRDIQVGDLDGDGRQDLAGTSFAEGKLWYSTDKQNATPLSGNLNILRLANANTNKQLELLGANLSNNTIWYKQINCTWKQIPNTVPIGDLIVGDVNADGRDDLLVINRNNNSLRLSTNWSTWKNLSGNLSQAALVDLDSDGDKDIIGINKTNQSLWYTLDLGGSWTQIQGTYSKIAAGNFDNDGLNDDVIAISGDRDKTIYSTDLTTWQDLPAYWTRLPTGSTQADYWEDFVIADFDGNGISDIATIRENDRKIYISTNLNSWTSINGTADVIFSGDVNNDGAADIIAMNQFNGSVWITTDRGGSWNRLNF